MMYQRDQLEALGRKELQATAKALNIKANQASATLITAILEASSVIDVESDVNDVNDVAPQATVAAAPLVTVEKAVPSVQTAEPIELTMSAAPTEEVKVDSDALAVGDAVEVLGDDNVWAAAVVTKVNKKTVRVEYSVTVNGAATAAATVKFDVVRKAINTPVIIEESEQPSEPVEIAIDENARITEVLEQSTEVVTEFEQARQSVFFAPFSRHSIERNVEAPVIANHEPEPTLFTSAAKLDVRSLASPGTAVRRWSIGSKNGRSALKSSSVLKSGEKPRQSLGPVRRFSMTPNKTFAQPTIVPKLNKAQLARQEAVKNKLQKMDGNVKSTTVAVPKNLKPQSVTTFIKSRAPDGPTAVTGATTAATTGAARKSTVPDFAKMHTKQFQGQKAITDVVERSDKIVKNIDESFQQALNGVPNLSAPTSKTFLSSTASVVTKPTASANDAPTAFKARSMPNFSALHSKQQKSHVSATNKVTVGVPAKAQPTIRESESTENKENTSNAHSSSNVAMRDRVNKPSKNIVRDSVVSGDKCRDQRRDSFMAANKSKRDMAVASKRMTAGVLQPQSQPHPAAVVQLAANGEPAGPFSWAATF